LLGAAIDGWRRAEHTTCELARYLLRTHDHERRQLATELHDGIAQDLVAARWLAERDCTSGSQSEHAAGKRLEAILQKSIGDLRATSYLLHPPLLDQAGLEAALRSFVLEHGARAGQRIDLAISSSLGRQSPEVELAVFRLVQDALAHGDLHPGSNHAYSRIQLNQVGGEILLTIEKQHPNGEGRTLLSTMQRFVPTRGARAVKLAGMRERLRQIGGRFEVHSRIGTTVIRAVIPHRPKMREF
jgi:signal transduction histidine kinase